jgi:hypothetical protein
MHFKIYFRFEVEEEAKVTPPATCVLLGSLFHPENGLSTFLRNSGNLLRD